MSRKFSLEEVLIVFFIPSNAAVGDKEIGVEAARRVARLTVHFSSADPSLTYLDIHDLVGIDLVEVVFQDR